MKNFILKHLFNVDLEAIAAEERRMDHLLGDTHRAKSALEYRVRQLESVQLAQLSINHGLQNGNAAARRQLLALWSRAYPFLPAPVREEFKDLGHPENLAVAVVSNSAFWHADKISKDTALQAKAGVFAVEIDLNR